MYYKQKQASFTFILQSILADNSKWPDLGNSRIAATPLEWPDQVCISLFGRKHLSGGSSDLRSASESFGMCKKDRPW